MAEKIRKRVTVFAEGKIQIVDLNEKGNIVKRYSDQGREITVQKVEEVVAESDKPVTKQQLMAALKAKGITFKATSSNKVLQALLDGEDSQDEDDKQDDQEPRDVGTGSQDVI